MKIVTKAELCKNDKESSTTSWIVPGKIYRHKHTQKYRLGAALKDGNGLVSLTSGFVILRGVGNYINRKKYYIEVEASLVVE